MTKNRPIQIMIILGVISLISLIAVQVYWVSMSVTAEEETFDHNVRMSLRAVADDMCQIDGNELINSKPIDRISRNYFVARLRYNIDVSVLDSLILHQFDQRGINQDFEYGVYDCESDRMVFGSEVSPTSDRKTSRISLPTLATDEYYFGVYFPNKTGGLLTNLTIWKYMTAATVLMLGFFSYGLVVVLKQRRLSEIQKDFIDNVTHELKTPLATLKLSAEAILKNGDPAKTAKYASIIDQETRRLEQHVNQILSSSLVENSASKSLVTIQLDAWLVDQLERFKEDYPQVDWRIELGQLGSIQSHTNALQTAVRNLIDNAIKYGGGMIKITAKRTKKHVEITVTDNGPGIPKSYRKKIFDKFFRIPTDNVHDVKGYGLGLYLVRENLRLIRGKISLISDKTGSIFTISLPIK